jgi:hypothetical protein
MRFPLLLTTAALVAAAGVAQEPPKAANATPGTFRSYVVLDQRTDAKDPKGKRNVAGFEHDLIVSNELNPTVAVFSRIAKPDDATAKLVGKLKDLSAAHKTLEFGAYLFFPVLDKVYADDAKAKATADELQKWGEAIPVGPVVIGLSEKESGQTKAWNLPDTGLVIVFYNRHKVIKKWELADTSGITDEVLAALAAEVNKELKK